MDFVKRYPVHACALLLLISVALHDVMHMAPAQAATSGRNFQVTGQTLPPTLTSPTKVQGGTTNTDTDVMLLILANTGSTDRTVTVTDCSSSVFYLFNAYTLPAKAMWALPLYNTRFKGCLKWSATSTEIMGTIVGTY